MISNIYENLAPVHKPSLKIVANHRQEMHLSLLFLIHILLKLKIVKEQGTTKFSLRKSFDIATRISLIILK